MALVIFAPGLRRLAGGAAMLRSTLETLDQVIEEVCERHPDLREVIGEGRAAGRPVVRVFVNDGDATQDIFSDLPLEPADRVLLFHPIAGG